MMRIGVVIHGPAVIDSGKARYILETLSDMGDVRAILGGTMGRSAVIDAGLEDMIDISRNLKPSESILSIIPDSDIVILVNEGKSCETGLTFGSRVIEKPGILEKHLYQIELGDSCLLIPWSGVSHPFFHELEKTLNAQVVNPPPQRKGIEIHGTTIKRKVAGVRPGEFVTVNGIVIGKALSNDICIISESGMITGLQGGSLKQHGVEKLVGIDLALAIVRSGPLRTANIKPRVLERSSSGYAVIIDHAAEDTFEIAIEADFAVVVGDDTTAIAGDLLTRLNIPLIGITDGDKDGITHYTHMPPGSVIIRVAPGNDDIVGRKVHEEIFGGNRRMKLEDAGFEDIVKGVMGLASGLVAEVVHH